MATDQAASELQSRRRSANYKPTIWKHDLLESLTSNYNEQVYTSRKEELKVAISHMFDTKEVVSLQQLELIDDIQRLGLDYLFAKEIKKAMDFIHAYVKDNDNDISDMRKNNLNMSALCFRLLRQYGYDVCEDLLGNFMDRQGNMCHGHDIKGVMSLFEASFLAFEGENILDVAKAITSEHLKAYRGDMDVGEVTHALELPRYWRMQKLESRWYIDQYARHENKHHALLELAKLEFNIVQSAHQEDLKELSKWWTNLGLMDELKFSRDRIVEAFLASVGLMPEPHFRYLIKGFSKVAILLTTIDDVYDIYGTLDELELFTVAVERWDLNAIAHLPYYMQICFLALYNTVNEFAYDSLKANGLYIMSYLKNTWIDLCKSFLVEAKWYHSGYVPTFEEYMENAWVSSGGYTLLLHAYVFVGHNITIEALDYLETKPNLVRFSSMILRLADDFVTSKEESERGDVSKSIQCYMHQTGVSEEVASKYMRHLIDDTWKKMNKELFADSRFPRSFGVVAVNLARTAQYMFQYGNGFGNPDDSIKDQILSLFVRPIPLARQATSSLLPDS